MANFIELPNCIYVVGGAGKKLMLNTLQKCWFLKEILKPMPKPNNCKVFIIDTALDEENDDLIKINDIKQKMSEITAEYPTPDGLTVGKITIEYRLLTSEMLLKSRVDIIGEKVTNAIHSSTNARIWWLYDPLLGDEWNDKIINRANLDTMNFSKGVYRKRAMGKAIYYKALAEGKFLVEDQGPDIDIICGLGGGTGSGIVIDLAKEIKRVLPASNVNLFGILSTLNESEEEKANCACMLHELEYLKINDSNIFKNMILLPMEPTQYCGNTGINVGTLPLLRQFDETFPFVLMSYHNTGGAERIFDLNPSFAPFTFAIPQITRYNIDQIKRFNKELTDSLWHKVYSLTEEHKINQHISRFLSQNYKFTEVGLDINDRTYLYDRYLKLKLLANLDYFKTMECERVLLLKKALDAAETSLQVTEEYHLIENILELFARIRAEIEGNSLDVQDKKLPIKHEDTSNSDSESKNCISDDDSISIEELDRRASSIIYNDILILDEMALLFMQISQIREETVKNILIGILKQQDENLGRKLNRTRTSLGNYERERAAKEMEKGALESEKANIDMKISNSAKSLNKRWLDASSKNLKRLKRIDEVNETIIQDFTSLYDNLSKYVQEVVSLRSKDEKQPLTKPVKDKLDEIKKQMNEVGIDFKDHSIIGALDTIYKLKINYLIYSHEKTRGQKVLDAIIPGRSASDKEKDEAKSQIGLLLVPLNDVTLDIDMKSGLITFNYSFDIKNKMETTKTDCIKKIIDDAELEVERNLGHVEKSAFDYLENDLESTKSDQDLTLEPVIKIYHEYDSKINTINDSISSLEKDLILSKLNEAVYSSLELTIRTIVSSYVKNIGSMKMYEAYFNTKPNDGVKCKRSDESYAYIKEIAPSNVYRLLAPKSDINNVISDPKEKVRLINNVKECLEKIYEMSYNGLVTNSIESVCNQKRWDHTRISLVVITKARDIKEDVFAVGSEIKRKFGLDEKHTSHPVLNEWDLDVADDWSVATVAYIGGVLPDNIRNYIEPCSGYFSTLKTLADSKRSFFHHSLKLEDGTIINRKRLYEINNDKEIFLKNGLDITTELQSNFDEIDFKDRNNQSSLL